MIFQKPLWKLFNLNDNSSAFETFGCEKWSSIELTPERFLSDKLFCPMMNFMKHGLYDIPDMGG